MVSKEEIRSIYRNILRREPDPGGMAAMLKKGNALAVASAIFESDEFIRPHVAWVLNFWLQRMPVDREITEWTANWRRLGAFDCEWHISYTRESLDHFRQGVNNLPVAPDGKTSLWNTREYTNHAIKRFIGRDPNPPGDTIANAQDGEWLRFFGGLFYGTGAEPITKQIMRFTRKDLEAVKYRVQYNYNRFIGRDATSAEVRHWEPHLEWVDVLPHFAASPEGLRHGINLCAGAG